MSEATASLIVPGAILPGRHAIVGSRSPPSHVVALPPRNGPVTPAFVP